MPTTEPSFPPGSAPGGGHADPPRPVQVGRRAFVVGAATLLAGGRGAAAAALTGARDMYGLIGTMKATAGQREALIAVLLEGTGAMPGCLSYIVAKDTMDAETLWITEVWDSKASHDASLSLPAVQRAISRARPLIAGFGNGTVTTPVGGFGLPSSG